MRLRRQLVVAIAFLILQLLPAFADDIITNVMSPLVSYQYYDALGTDTNSQIISPVVSYQFYDSLEHAGTNSVIISPIASYQYFDSLDAGSVNFLTGPQVSYYYPFLGTPVLNIIPTNRTPTATEIALVFATVANASQLLLYHGGFFSTNLASIDSDRPTVVFTHGWNSNPDVWGLYMATLIAAKMSPAPNIVAWDWSIMARQRFPGTAEAQTGDQGRILGNKLQFALGANYSKPIQFVGHSLGTLVNASAANFVHGERWAQENVSSFPWPATNTLMTLFDEAEAATGIDGLSSAIDALSGKNGNPFLPKKSYDHPLPKHFAWAENYVAAFGLLHPEAANVILTNGFPSNSTHITSWLDELISFHSYPINWYDGTIPAGNSAMGFSWPLAWLLADRATFMNAPSAGSVYTQVGAGRNLVATNWNYGTNLLAARFQAYRENSFHSLTGQSLESATVNGRGNGQNVVGALPAFTSFLLSIYTAPTNVSTAPPIKVYPHGPTPHNANGNTNIPAYAWMQLVIPANAVSMSFDYKIQGDWKSDSLAAAFNGTNVLSLPGSQIETNVLFNSGSIDISSFAGHTNEFFIGIVGSTSTNAQLTVQNLAYSIPSPPLLLAQWSGNGFVLSWPLSAADYVLQTSTTLGDPNSWTVVTNIPAIVNLQSAITNQIFDGARFYRLKK